MSISLTLVAVIGCSSEATSQQRELEKLGYSNVKVVNTEQYPYIFSAVVNGCEVYFFIAKDREVWDAIIQKTANGRALNEQSYTPGEGVILNAGRVEDLKKRERFAHICPP
ncbi:MAG TPA: hypothetical protein VGO98_01910 [Candidatus Saccharimonadales bacterium]|jgi:hypothetical protein|nr:hypothetical protein [Candidatus Saccharimonadales bacterium]